MKKYKITIKGKVGDTEYGYAWNVSEVTTTKHIDSEIVNNILTDTIVARYITEDLPLEDLLNNIKITYNGFQTAKKEYEERDVKRL